MEISKETIRTITEIREITGETEDVIISTAVEGFLKKHVLPVASMASMLGFGVFHKFFMLVNL